MIRTGFLATIALGLLACDPHDEEWDELERAEARWEMADIDAYALTLEYSCECLVYGEFAIVVEGDSIVSAKRVDDSNPGVDTIPAMTVPMMFDRIRTSLRRDPHETRLVFDEVGVPRDVYFDFDENTMDEEWGFGVDEFTELYTGS